MKKLLIGMLLIIPVIVILIVSATASIVQGAHIAVESVVMYKPEVGGTGIVEIKEPILAYISDVGIQLEAIVYPTQASNQSIEWTVENETVRLGARVLSVDDNGYVSYFGLGTADVVATAEGNIKARCRIFVTSSDVMGISITNNLPELFTVGDRFQLEATVNPADAETSQRYLNWSIVKGKDFVDVDQNGIITALKSGSVTVRASLKNPPEKLAQEHRFAEISFVVVEKAETEVFITDVLTTNGTGYDLHELTNTNYTDFSSIIYTSSNGQVVSNRYLRNVEYAEGNTISATITASVGGVEVASMDIVFKKIYLKNSDMWARLSGEEKVYLTLNSAGIHLEAVAETKAELAEVTIVSTNEEVAEIANGYVVAKNVGESIITVTNGDFSESFVVKVLPPIYGLDLVYDNADDDVGVQMKRVFGSKSYSTKNGGSLTNTLGFEINSIFTVVNGATAIVSSTQDIMNLGYLYEWELDSDSISRGFSISDSGVLTIGTGKQASIKLKAKYPLYESIEISAVYKATFVEKGVNVGIVTDATKQQWAEEEKNARDTEIAINQLALSGFDFVNAQAKAQYDATGKNDNYAIVLHSGVIMNKVDKALYCSLYGNGNTLRQTREDASYDEAFFGGMDCATLKVVVDDITIQNVVVRAAKALDSDQSLFDYRFAGNGIVVDGRDKYFKNGAENTERLKNININYVIIENAYYCLFVAAADVAVKGAIIRNSGAQSLYINTSVQDFGTGATKKVMNAVVSLNNTVFSNAVNMSIGIITEDLDESYDEDETVIVDGNSVTRPKYYSYFEKVTSSVLNISGFCEIYNWKSAKQLDFTFVKASGMSDAQADMVNAMIKPLLEDENSWNDLSGMLKGIDIKQFMCRDKNGVPHFQLAIGNIGVHYPMSGTIPEADKKAIGLTGVVEMDISAFQKLAPGAHIKFPLEFYCYDVENPAIGPDDTFVGNKKLFQRMAG